MVDLQHWCEQRLIPSTLEEYEKLGPLEVIVLAYKLPDSTGGATVVTSNKTLLRFLVQVSQPIKFRLLVSQVSQVVKNSRSLVIHTNPLK